MGLIDENLGSRGDRGEARVTRSPDRYLNTVEYFIILYFSPIIQRC